MNAALPPSPFSATSEITSGKIDEEKTILLQLTADLHLVQNRLGTSHEQTGDCQLAQDLGHKIRNKLHVLQSLDALGVIELPPHIRNMKLPCSTSTESAS